MLQAFDGQHKTGNVLFPDGPTRTTGRSSMPETPEEYESKLYADDFAAGETQ